jgi:hypothetical protein
LPVPASLASELLSHRLQHIGINMAVPLRVLRCARNLWWQRCVPWRLVIYPFTAMSCSNMRAVGLWGTTKTKFVSIFGLLHSTVMGKYFRLPSETTNSC